MFLKLCTTSLVLCVGTVNGAKSVVRSMSIQSTGQVKERGRTVVRNVKASKKESFDDEQANDNEVTNRPSTRDTNCVAWKDARFLDYLHDGLFQYEDFTNRVDADIFFEEEIRSACHGPVWKRLGGERIWELLHSRREQHGTGLWNLAEHDHAVGQQTRLLVRRSRERGG